MFLVYDSIKYVENWNISFDDYRADKKYKKCSGKLWFKGQLQVDSFLDELIFTLLSLIS